MHYIILSNVMSTLPTSYSSWGIFNDILASFIAWDIWRQELLTLCVRLTRGGRPTRVILVRGLLSTLIGLYMCSSCSSSPFCIARFSCSRITSAIFYINIDGSEILITKKKRNTPSLFRLALYECDPRTWFVVQGFGVQESRRWICWCALPLLLLSGSLRWESLLGHKVGHKHLDTPPRLPALLSNFKNSTFWRGCW